MFNFNNYFPLKKMPIWVFVLFIYLFGFLFCLFICLFMSLNLLITINSILIAVIACFKTYQTEWSMKKKWGEKCDTFNNNFVANRILWEIPVTESLLSSEKKIYIYSFHSFPQLRRFDKAPNPKGGYMAKTMLKQLLPWY